MNGLKTLAYSTLAAILITASAVADEPGKKGLAMSFSAIGAVTPYVAFGAATPNVAFVDATPGGHLGVGARIALSDVADLSFGHALLIAPSGLGDQGELVPAHSLTLGLDYRF